MRSERQARAARAAQGIAARHGLRCAQPRLLSDCNNTIVHLAPWPVVAKVADLGRRPSAAGRLQRELDVAVHLARAGAPVAPPSGELPVQLHHHRGHVVTFWVHQEHAPARDTGRRTLGAVHRALETYPGDLPPFRPLPDARSLLRSPGADRDLLLDEHARLARALRGYETRWRPLHGDPHRGNLLLTPAGCRWIDFESACLGPLEWDLSALPGTDGGAPDGVDAGLLALLRRARSLRTLVWCRNWAGSGPEVARAAATHLELLRAA